MVVNIVTKGVDSIPRAHSSCTSKIYSSYRVEERIARGDPVVEYPLRVCTMFWSRSDIMHVAAWDSKPLLLLTTALQPNRSTESFQMEAGPLYDKQRIQMGLRKGNTALIYFWSGVFHYQCVLIALASDLSNSKPRQGQHKFWRYVSLLRTYFARLPEQLARRAVLDMQPRIPYGEVYYLAGLLVFDPSLRLMVLTKENMAAHTVAEHLVLAAF